MENMLLALVPAFLLVALGALVRRIQLINAQSVEGFKTLIVRVALPAVLFSAFAKSKMGFDYLLIFVLVFVLCVVLFLSGKALHSFFPKAFPDEYTDAYFSGFEFGMIGIGLFPAIWGMDRLPEIALIAFGHELFIWFVYVPLLEARKSGVRSRIGKIAGDFFKSPTIIAIILGSAVNLSGAFLYVEATLAGKILMNALSMVGGVIAPLILIVIGYSISFRAIPLKKSLLLLGARWTAVLVFGLGTAALMRYFVPASEGFLMTALFAFLLLPPPFIIPVFIRKGCERENSFFSELLIYYTLLSFGAYVVLMMII